MILQHIYSRKYPPTFIKITTHVWLPHEK